MKRDVCLSVFFRDDMSCQTSLWFNKAKTYRKALPSENVWMPHPPSECLILMIHNLECIISFLTFHLSVNLLLYSLWYINAVDRTDIFSHWPRIPSPILNCYVCIYGLCHSFLNELLSVMLKSQQNKTCRLVIMFIQTFGERICVLSSTVAPLFLHLSVWLCPSAEPFVHRFIERVIGFSRLSCRANLPCEVSFLLLFCWSIVFVNVLQIWAV